MKASSNSDKQTIATNAVWNWCGFAVSVAVTFVMCPILVRGLGDERYGIWSVVEATVAYLALLDLGIGASVVRYVAKFDEIDDKHQLDRVFSTTLSLFAGAGGIALAISAGLALLWQHPFGIPAELATEGRWLIALLGANVALGLVVGVFGSALYGLARFPARVLIDSGVRIATAVIFLTILATGGGIVQLGIAILGATVVKGVIQAIVVRHYLPHLRFSPRLVNAETFRVIRGYSARAFVAMIAGRISYSSDAIVIGAFLAPSHITFFVVAARLTEYVKNAMRSFTNVLTPAISAFEARGDHEAIRRVFLDASRYVLWLILPIEMGLIILGKPFLSLWLGERYAEASYPTLVILSIPLTLTLSQSVSGRILFGIGRLTWLTVASVVEALANLLISVALVRPFGIEGVAIGTAVPATCLALALACYMCRVLEIPVLLYFRESVAKPLVVLPVAPVTWLMMMQLLPPTNWLSLIAAGGVGSLAYAVAAYLLEFRLRTRIVRLSLLDRHA